MTAVIADQMKVQFGCFKPWIVPQEELMKVECQLFACINPGSKTLRSLIYEENSNVGYMQTFRTLTNSCGLQSLKEKRDKALTAEYLTELTGGSILFDDATIDMIPRTNKGKLTPAQKG